MTRPGDDITAMLETADPGRLSAEERAELKRMVRATSGSRLRRFAPRSAATVIAAGALLAVGGAAAAATLGVWQPWAQEPDLTVEYTMTDGRVCEYRIEFSEGATDRTREALADAFEDPDILSPAAIDAAIATIRADPGTQRDADTGAPMGYGTESYDPEWEYFNAVNAVISAHLTAQGAPGPATRGQAECE
ncbi:hypothetical protein DY023_00865 [Microbacterium bovistercoris]|uniref:Uncharacterized protein n=1 Tax=Microbacterium bovistercoris TaxID=2293570 RepID=A0A371NY85_9MICO|nr:hypothetical protein [Microbacterium bovistercoris]REJ08550.1 hypothetical protein DY023_00865 [Microbacterium bovistercoris]